MPMRNLMPALAGVALAAVTAVVRQKRARRMDRRRPARSPRRPAPNSSEPQIVDSGRGRILSWVERAGKTSHLKFAERSGIGMVARGDCRVRKRLVPQLRGRPVGHAPERRNARRAVAAAARPDHGSVQPAPFVLEGQRQDMGAFVHAAQRRHEDAARLRVARRDAGQHARRRLARRTQQSVRFRQARHGHDDASLCGVRLRLEANHGRGDRPQGLRMLPDDGGRNLRRRAHRIQGPQRRRGARYRRVAPRERQMDRCDAGRRRQLEARLLPRQRSDAHARADATSSRRGSP